MKINKTPTLITYQDWLKKAKYELQQYEISFGVYDMANCFLTINAIPEWIEKSKDAPKNLRNLATKKITVMKGLNFEFDETKLTDINQKLRLVRIFCNHSKHGDPKEKLKQISMSSTLPLTLPVKFENLTVGTLNIKAIDILKAVIQFWSNEFEIA